MDNGRFTITTAKHYIIAAATIAVCMTHTV